MWTVLKNADIVKPDRILFQVNLSKTDQSFNKLL